ncbi:MAG: PDZ domain-containing protein [Candidatus Falkowbacteria bacterium]
MNKNKIFLVSMIVGISLLGGILGEMLVRFYFFKDLYAVPYGNEVNLDSSQFNKANVTISAPQKVVVSQDFITQDTLRSINDGLIAIFKKQTPSKTAVVDDKNNYYDLNNPLSFGLALTNDGWILVSAANFDAIKTNLDSYVAITKNKKAYQIDNYFQSDNKTLSFVHLANVNDLALKNMSDFSDILPGQSVIAVNWKNDVLLSSIISTKRQHDIIRSTDKLDDQLFLIDPIADRFANSLLFDLTGNLAGIIDAQKNILPITDFKSEILNVLKTRRAVSSFLGVNYLDLSQTVKNDFSKYGDNLRQIGALIYPDANHMSIVKSSPADLAGLAEGDIITSVDDIEINEYNDLGEIVQSKKIGDKILVKYLRGSEAKSVEIIIGEKK